jgi:hypothetical protein
MLFNVFTVFKDWLRQYGKPYSVEFCGLISIPLETLECFLHSFYVLLKIWDGKGPKCMALASPCPKTWFPPPNKTTCKGWGLYRKNSYCTAWSCNLYKVCRYMTFKNLAFWTPSFDLQNWPYFSSWRKNSSTVACLYFSIKQWSQYPRIFKLGTGTHRPNL